MVKFHLPKNEKFFKKLFNNQYDAPLLVQDLQDSDQNAFLQSFASIALYHPDLIILFSPDGEIVMQNREFPQPFNFFPKNKQDFKKVVSHTFTSVFDKAFKHAQNGKSEKHEIVIQDRNENSIDTIITFIPVKWTRDDVQLICLIIENVTKINQLIKELSLKESHLSQTQEIANIGSWEYIFDEDKFKCSDYFYEIFGVNKSESLSLDNLFTLVHPDDNQSSYQKVMASRDNQTGLVNEFRIYHGKSKELRYLKVRAEMITENESVNKLVGVVIDETASKRLENRIKNTNKQLKHILNHVGFGAWLKEYPTGKFVYLSKGLEEIFQISLEEIHHNPELWEESIHPNHKELVCSKQLLLEQGESIEHQYQITLRDGTTKWIYDQTIPWMKNNGEIKYLFGIVTDITSKKEMEEKLNYLATHDPLTGLPNQNSLSEKLDISCENAQPFALLYLNIDRLNIINDSLGYQIGEQVLKKIADRISNNLPDKDYIARIDSNNFVIIINYKNKKDVFTFAQQVTEGVEKPLVVNDYDLHLTASMGISFFPDNGNHKQSLLENARTALYHAKQQGKSNFQVYSFSNTVSSYKQYTLEKDMRKAIINEEFELYYQPQVEPEKGLIQGAEVLLRWNHEEWGLVSPGEFIPLAEENHLINQISDWVIRKVCAQLREWKDHNYPIRPISINISPIRFMKKGLVEFVQEHLELYQLSGTYLHFEITENSLLKNGEHVLSTLKGLKDLGVKIAIDDFGTGYASLSYLHEFHADFIKIDKSFVENLHNENHNDKAIVSAILHLANGLNIQTIAEGVEVYEQFEYLKQKECDFIQGYLYSKPVPLKEFDKMLKVGYLKPSKPKPLRKPDIERRKYYRFCFPYYVPGNMTIAEINKRKVNLGSTKILIVNIGAGGIKMLSSLKLPIQSNMIFQFKFTIMDTEFNLNGKLIWKDEAKGDTFFYGVSFHISETEKEKLVHLVNKMTVIHKQQKEIPDTPVVYENAVLFLQNRHS